MRLAGIDLNLLSSLDAILDEKNVTRAARRLGVSQPAASHSLRKLRELLGDELLVRTPAGMRPTPRAIELQPAVRAALAAAESVLQAAPAFDPARAERTFAIAVVDQCAFTLLPPLVQRLVRDAPGVRVDVRPVPQDRLIEHLASELDLVVGVFRDAPAGVRDAALWREDFVCVIRKHSSAARGPFTLERFLALPHLFVAPRGLPGSPLDDALARAGHRRRIVMQVPHFLVAPQLVATSDLVWTAPANLAHGFATQLPLVLRDPPFPVAGFTVVMRWHVRLDRDPGLAWLRGVLLDAAPAR